MSDFSCPTDVISNEKITLAHGGGGRLSQDLYKNVIKKHFNENLNMDHDAALVSVEKDKLLFSTDSYVVTPIFFKGGNIGSLAICGTVNDIAMGGGKPRYLSCSLIIEEGFPIAQLEQILSTMRLEADKAQVDIVTGDTKVVNVGQCDKIFINTSGFGEAISSSPIHPSSIKAGDSIIVSGDLGRHGVAILAARKGIEIDSDLESDCESLNLYVENLIKQNIKIHCLRDITRGGLVSSLIEMAESSELSFFIEEDKIPVHPQVHSICSLLGLEPIHLANEGRFVLICPESEVSNTLNILKKMDPSKDPLVIGKVLKKESQEYPLIMETKYGVERVLTMENGEQLPRIC